MKRIWQIAKMVLKRSLQGVAILCVLVIAAEIGIRLYIHFRYPLEVLHLADKPIQDKEAILLLLGFANSPKGQRYGHTYFSQYPRLGYDVLIPDYIDDDSMTNTIANLKAFIAKHHVEDYRALHIYGTIMGTRVANQLLQDTELKNLKTIIYDRNPIHELAPAAFTQEHPEITSFTFGDIEFDLAKPYQPLKHPEKYRIGLLIESSLIGLITTSVSTGFISKSHFSPDKYSFLPEKQGERFDDYTYVWADHAQMYYRWDLIGPQVLHFIKNGRFTPDARRTPLDIDPWSPPPPPPYQDVDLAALLGIE